MNRFFASGSEFAGIERMFTPAHFARDGRGLGDDAFVWAPAPHEIWVTSTDVSVEGVHYRTDWATRPQALRKALLSNLSDINAMGGRTRHVLLGLGATPAFDMATFEALGEELRALEGEHGFRVVGGDTTRSDTSEFFAFTVMGVVGGQPLLRSGARAGHRVYVSGSLGASAGGLDLFRNPRMFVSDPARAAEVRARCDQLRGAHLFPSPPLDLGPLLAEILASQRAHDEARSIAAIDLSDGLSSELGHIARQSDCALTIDFDALPAHAALSVFDSHRVRAHVLHGGEDYQLLFTGTFTAEELARLRAVAQVTDIGTVTAGEGVFLTQHGVTQPLPPGGFTH